MNEASLRRTSSNGPWARAFVALVISSSSLGCPSPTVLGHDVALPPPSSAPAPIAAQAKAALDGRQWERAAALYDDLAQASRGSIRDRANAETSEASCFVALRLPAVALSLDEEVIATAEDGLDAVTSVKAVLRMNEAPEGERARIVAELRESIRPAVLAKLEAEDASRLHYLFAIAFRSERKHAEALRELDLVTGPDAVRAQILAAVIHVNERHSVPAVQALEKAHELAAAMKDPNEARRGLDEALLLEGDVYYSAAMKPSSSQPKKIVVDASKLSEAIKLWKRIPDSSALANDARWQSAWATFTAGDYPTTRASLDSALGAPNAYLPEAELLRATAEWAAKDDKKAKAHLEAFVPRYARVVDGLRALAHELDTAPDAPRGLLRMTLQPKEAHLDADLERAVVHATSDKELHDRARWVEELESEMTSLATPPPAMGHAGDHAKDRVSEMTRAAELRFRGLAGDRIFRETDELDSLLRAARGALETVNGPKHH